MHMTTRQRRQHHCAHATIMMRRDAHMHDDNDSTIVLVDNGTSRQDGDR